MPTPYTRLTTAQVSALLTTQLGNLKPYQIRQVTEFLDRFKFTRGSNSDVSVESTISTLVTALNSQNV